MQEVVVRAVRKAVRAATMTFAAISMRRCFFMVCDCGMCLMLQCYMLQCYVIKCHSSSLSFPHCRLRNEATDYENQMAVLSQFLHNGGILGDEIEARGKRE